MKTSSVEFISRSPNPLPMKSEHRRFSSGLHGSTAADSVRSEWPLWHAAKSNAVFARRRIEMKLKLLDIRAELEREKGERERGSIVLPVWLGSTRTRPSQVSSSLDRILPMQILISSFRWSSSGIG
ncbi:hypothetical protein TNCV_3774031 [Trichonephila clavipes]|nr:hypothetical protein TNCV_3774031 [Trichonephila clavipes]